MLKRCLHFLIVTFLIFGAVEGWGQVIFYTQSFETISGYSFPNGNGGSGQDFFDRTNLAGAPAQEVFTYNGFDGSFFVAGEDIDGTLLSGPIGEVLISGVNISGQSSLEVTIAFASGTNIDIDDANDAMWVEVSIDGGSFVEIGRFEADPNTTSGSGFNGQFAEDTDGDNDGDGILLDGNFTDFTWPIQGTGNTLDIRISMYLNSGDEEGAFDNVRVAGISSSTPTITLTPSSLTGFTYVENAGPSSEQSFTVSGSNLTNDINLSLGGNTNFEWSLTSGGPYQTTDLTITESGGSANDIVYVRMVSGLTAGNYNATGTATSAGASNETISLNGSVTSSSSCPNPGDLVINEIMYNPSGSESTDEWFEVCNVTGSDIDMDGFDISDNGGGSFSVSGSLIIPAGGCIVFAQSSGGGCSTPDYNYSNAFGLNNSGDILTLECNSTIIDEVDYSDMSFPSVNNGEALQLDPSFQNASDNDTGTNWCAAISSCGGSDFGTPGSTNSGCGCGLSGLSSLSYNCLTNIAGAGNDHVLIEIPYTGVDANVTLSSTGSTPVTNVGDNPASVSNGTIQLSGATEGDSWEITISGGACNFVIPGTVPSTQCDPFSLIGGGMIINEMGNLSGACCSGSGVEYYELLVIGDPANPTANVNLTGWIVDDNNGEFQGFGSGTGMANGHIALGGCFSSVPPGSLIVIYAEGGGCSASNYGLTDDPNDGNGDDIYVLPTSNSSCLTYCQDLPCNGTACGGVNTVNTAYSPCLVTSTPSCEASLIGSANSNDAAQVRRPDGAFFHGFSWGLSSPFPTFPNGNSSFNLGSGNDWSYTSCDNATLSGSFSSPANSAGAANNAANANIITAISNGNIDYDEFLGTSSNPSGNCLEILPVELGSFEAIKKNQNSLLSWKTLTELNNNYFNIERSADGINYETIGQVDGAGTTNIPQEYTFTDRQPLSGTNYYRLKQVDFDGQFEYSRVQLVNFEVTTNFVIYPTLVHQQLIIESTQSIDQESIIEIYNMIGQRVMQATLSSGNYQTALNLADLPAGQYIVTLRYAGGTITQRIEKL